MNALKRYFNQISSDFYRLIHMKSLYIGLGITVLMVLIVALAQNALSEFILNADFNQGVEEINPDEIKNSIAFMVLSGAPNAAGVYFLTPIIIAIFIGAEFSGGTMRLYIGRGANKAEIYFSKFTVSFAVVLFYTLFSFLACFIAALGMGMSDAFFSTYSASLSKAFGAYILLALTAASIYTAISFLVRSKAGNVGILLAMHIVIGSVLVTIVQAALGMTAGATAESFRYMYLNPYYCMSAVASIGSMKSADIGLALGGAAMWSVLFTVAGLIPTLKRDVK